MANCCNLAFLIFHLGWTSLPHSLASNLPVLAPPHWFLSGHPLSLNEGMLLSDLILFCAENPLSHTPAETGRTSIMCTRCRMFGANNTFKRFIWGVCVLDSKTRTILGKNIHQNWPCTLSSMALCLTWASKAWDRSCLWTS